MELKTHNEKNFMDKITPPSKIKFVVMVIRGTFSEFFGFYRKNFPIIPTFVFICFLLT